MSRELRKTRAPKALPTLTATASATASKSRMPSESRRQQLIKVAIRLFSQRGYKGTTTKDIAQAAGVNQAILFRHFATKEALYAAILEYKANTSRTVEWLAELRQHAARRDDEALFRAVIARLLRHKQGDKDFMRLMLFSALEGHELAQSFRDKRIRPVFNFLSDYITTRQREGAFRITDPGVAVRALFALPSYHAQVKTLFNCSLLVTTDEEAATNFTRLILDGLRAAPQPKPKFKRQTNARLS